MQYNHKTRIKKPARTYILRLLTALLACLFLCTGLLGGCASPEAPAAGAGSSSGSVSESNADSSGTISEDAAVPSDSISEDGSYTGKDEVALYIHTYGHLPDNFITKKEAKKLGWVSQEGNLHQAAPGKSIGGDHFGNYEGQLPEKKGRSYYECDIDADGGYRGAKRIIYSNDGLVYYTEDHYKTFTLLYGEES